MATPTLDFEHTNFKSYMISILGRVVGGGWGWVGVCDGGGGAVGDVRGVGAVTSSEVTELIKLVAIAVVRWQSNF